MGVSISRYSEISGNEYCLKFCSAEPISHNDPFWNKFLAFNIKPPTNAEEQLYFDSSVESLLENFLTNNPRTGNLGSLVQVFITRATELLTQPTSDCLMLSWQTYNALFVIRFVSKFLIEMIPESQLCLHFDVHINRQNVSHANDIENKTVPTAQLVEITPEKVVTENQAQDHNGGVQPEPKVFQKSSPRINANESKLEMLIDTLVGLIINVSVNDDTYYLHLECVNTLLVLMSVYIISSSHGNQRHIETSLIFRTLFQGRYCMHAPLLVKTLLQNFSAMHLAPLNMFTRVDRGGSVVLGIASGIWSILTLSTGAKRESILTRQLRDNDNLTQLLNNEHPLAVQSCLLLLAFTNHFINDDNLYRKALFAMQDCNSESSSQILSQQNGTQLTPPRININALHTALCATAVCEHATLLIYLLLNGCKLYRRYINSVPHIEHLVLPILKSLYSAPYVESYSHRLYMTVIVLLTLTEDEQLSRSLHQIDVKTPTWYTERSLTGLTLGGLSTLIIIRAIYASTVKIKDHYLYINCLASLANMSGEFRNLHPYVAQRLVSLIESIHKRIKKLSKQVEDFSLADGNTETSANYLVDVDRDANQDTIADNLQALETVLKMLLEIVNSCLSSQLQSNLNLVYALLYKKEFFEELAANKQISTVVQNIVIVIGFFSSRLERARDHAGSELGVAEVYANIQRSAQQWKGDRLKKFPELKFRYIEDERLEEFFTPYVWGLITSCGNIYWTSENTSRLLSEVVIH